MRRHDDYLLLIEGDPLKLSVSNPTKTGLAPEVPSQIKKFKRVGLQNRYNFPASNVEHAKSLSPFLLGNISEIASGPELWYTARHIECRTNRLAFERFGKALQPPSPAPP
jgi:hypothetical protein